MLEAQAGSFLSSGGMLREGLLQMAEEIAPLPEKELLSSKKQTISSDTDILFYLVISRKKNPEESV